MRHDQGKENAMNIQEKMKTEKNNEFNNELRTTVFKALMDIEDAFRESWLKVIRDKGFSDDSIDYYGKIKKEKKAIINLSKSSDAVREYYKKLPSDDIRKVNLPPLRLFLETVSFNAFVRLLNDLDQDDQKKVMSSIGINDRETFILVIGNIIKIRNICAHTKNKDNKYLYKLKFPKADKISIFSMNMGDKMKLKMKTRTFYENLSIIKHMLDYSLEKSVSNFSDRWRQNLYKLIDECHDPDIVKMMGFPSDWKESVLWKDPHFETISPTESALLHYGSSLYSIDLTPEKLSELKARVEDLSSRFYNSGWATVMDNYRDAAKQLVVKSMIGAEDDGHGFPSEFENLALALANGNKKNMLQAYNDFRVRRIHNDISQMDVPIDTSNEGIYEMAERWMALDNERSNSDFHNSIAIIGMITRDGGPVIKLHDILYVPTGPSIMRLDNAPFIGCGKRMDWMQDSVDKETMILTWKNSLEEKCGNDAVTDHESSFHTDYRDLPIPWSTRIDIDLDKANPEFTKLIENEYGLRDPDNVNGCGPYEAPLTLPLFPEEEAMQRYRRLKNS